MWPLNILAQQWHKVVGVVSVVVAALTTLEVTVGHQAVVVYAGNMPPGMHPGSYALPIKRAAQYFQPSVIKRQKQPIKISIPAASRTPSHIITTFTSGPLESAAPKMDAAIARRAACPSTIDLSTSASMGSAVLSANFSTIRPTKSLGSAKDISTIRAAFMLATSTQRSKSSTHLPTNTATLLIETRFYSAPNNPSEARSSELFDFNGFYKLIARAHNLFFKGMMILTPLAVCAIVLRDRRHFDMQVHYALFQRFEVAVHDDVLRLASATPWLAWVFAVLRAQADHQSQLAENDILVARIAFLENMEEQNTAEAEELHTWFEEHALIAAGQAERDASSERRHEAMIKEKSLELRKVAAAAQTSLNTANESLEAAQKENTSLKKQIDELVSAQAELAIEQKRQRDADAQVLRETKKRLADALRRLEAAKQATTPSTCPRDWQTAAPIAGGGAHSVSTSTNKKATRQLEAANQATMPSTCPRDWQTAALDAGGGAHSMSTFTDASLTAPSTCPWDWQTAAPIADGGAHSMSTSSSLAPTTSSTCPWDWQTGAEISGGAHPLSTTTNTAPTVRLPPAAYRDRELSGGLGKAKRVRERNRTVSGGL